MDDNDEFDDYWYELARTPPRGWCDDYIAHESHSYRAVNGNVYFCSGMTADELAEMIRAEAEAGTCEHGLSAMLCAGYGHYPLDRDG